MPFTHPFPAARAAARDVLLGATQTIRTHVRKVGDTARQLVDRVGSAAESYVGARIKRRVKPPIVVALVAAGVALAVALVAVFRR